MYWPPRGFRSGKSPSPGCGYPLQIPGRICGHPANQLDSFCSSAGSKPVSRSPFCRAYTRGSSTAGWSGKGGRKAVSTMSTRPRRPAIGSDLVPHWCHIGLLQVDGQAHLLLKVLTSFLAAEGLRPPMSLIHRMWAPALLQLLSQVYIVLEGIYPLWGRDSHRCASRWKPRPLAYGGYFFKRSSSMPGIQLRGIRHPGRCQSTASCLTRMNSLMTLSG